MNDGAVCRVAPATPSLLITHLKYNMPRIWTLDWYTRYVLIILNPHVSYLDVCISLDSVFLILSASWVSEGDKLTRPVLSSPFVVNVWRLECSPGYSKIIGKKKEGKSYFDQILRVATPLNKLRPSARWHNFRRIDDFLTREIYRVKYSFLKPTLSVLLGVIWLEYDIV